MKAIADLIREHGTTDSGKPIARQLWVRRELQQSAAISLARALRDAGVELEPFSWSYER